MSAGRVVRKLYHDSCAPTGLNPELQLTMKSAAFLRSIHFGQTVEDDCSLLLRRTHLTVITARFTHSIAIFT